EYPAHRSSCRAWRRYPGYSDRLQLTTSLCPRSIGTYFGFKGFHSARTKIHHTPRDAFVRGGIKRATQPVGVIAILEVLARMGAAGFFTLFGGDSGSFGHFQQVLQFQRLNACSIEGAALVTDGHVFDTRTQLGQRLNTLLHKLAFAEHAKVVLP